MVPAPCVSTRPVPPPAYHRAQAKVGPALHHDARMLITRQYLLALCRVAALSPKNWLHPRLFNCLGNAPYHFFNKVPHRAPLHPRICLSSSFCPRITHGIHRKPPVCGAP